jgi:hypothetical protein
MLSAAALVAGTISAAHAYGQVALDDPPLTDGIGQKYYVDQTGVDFSVSGLDEETDFYVGLCEDTAYQFNIPACTDFQELESDENGDLDGSLTIVKEGPNEHAGLFDQPDDINCEEPNRCYVVVADHNTKQIIHASVTFYVD